MFRCICLFVLLTFATCVSAQDFNLSISPTSVTATQGDTATCVMSVSPLGSFSSSIFFTASSPLEVVFSSKAVNAPYNSIGFYIVTGAADTGYYNVNIIAATKSYRDTVVIHVHVTRKVNWAKLSKPYHDPSSVVAMLDTAGKFVLLDRSSGTSLKTYTVSNGAFVRHTTDLPTSQLSIIDACYTSNGKLWFGTHEGVLSYDGSNFSMFNQSNSTLQGSDCWRITKDRNGNLVLIVKNPSTDDWYLYNNAGGTWNQLYTSNLTTNAPLFGTVDYLNQLWAYDGIKYSIFRINSGARYEDSGCEITQVRAMCITRDSAIWMANDDGATALKLLRSKNGSCQSFQLPNTVKYESIRCIAAATNSNDVWVGTTSALYRFSSGSWSRFTKDNSLLSDNQIVNVIADTYDNVWILQSDGVVVTNISGLVSVPLVSNTSDVEVSTDDSKSQMSVDQNGIRFVAQANNVELYDYLGNFVSTQETQPGTIQNLLLNHLQSGVYCLRNGNKALTFVYTR